METLPFRIDQLVLIVPAGNALADRTEIPFREVLDEPLVGLGHGSALQAHLASHAARAGRAVNFRLRVGGFEASAEWSRAASGSGSYPKLLRNDQVSEGRSAQFRLAMRGPFET
ncbi:hypothetical protein GCM10007036_36260 [Alsobacter metallidurans]|uniref:LysR substrate-binding domain-containing protein n=1 Tax=Alsobacter metallidurans TaxID=340221 RepID=A0A917IAZ2_9HYPH|nr:hypothetical protein GCM10007036_36260 [Alsobacter metallidurans]